MLFPKGTSHNQSTCRQHLPKVCVQQLHGQDEDYFGIFWDLLLYFWVGDNAQGRNLLSWIFWVHEVKKFKFGSMENILCGYRSGSISEKVQIFGERSISRNVVFYIGV